MPNRNPEAVAVANPDLESGSSGATLVAVEVAQHLKVHPSTVYKMAKRGELPGFKIGSDWRFDRVQIDQWVRSRIRGGEG